MLMDKIIFLRKWNGCLIVFVQSHLQRAFSVRYHLLQRDPEVLVGTLNSKFNP